jgi:hypothetical protein
MTITSQQRRAARQMMLPKCRAVLSRRLGFIPTIGQARKFMDVQLSLHRKGWRIANPAQAEAEFNRKRNAALNRFDRLAPQCDHARKDLQTC